MANLVIECFDSSSNDGIGCMITVNNVPINGLKSFDFHCDTNGKEQRCTFKIEGDAVPFILSLDKLKKQE